MLDAQDFDAFYADARERLLLQTYALTGDLPAAKTAVRDAFVAAWHHWRKVGKLDDPESWVRPHAWNRAQRRHTARIWHRDKGLDDDVRATLDALSKLSLTQRKVLLLTQLTSTSMEETAREVGLTDEDSAQQLQTASAQFALHRGVPSTTVPQHLMGLAAATEGSRFPRVTIIRRTGATRRRSHTLLGAAVAVAAVVTGGQLVHADDGASAALSREGPGAPAPPLIPALDVDKLLPEAQAAALLPNRTLGSPSTTDNTEGTGINIACQGARYADPRGYDALVRTWPAQGKRGTEVTESVELSRTDKAAERTYNRVLSWFGECKERRIQLVSTHAPAANAIGDDARVLVLRDWTAPITTYTVGVARTGKITTTVLRKVREPQAGRDEYPVLAPMALALQQSVQALCGNDGAGSCRKPKDDGTPSADPSTPADPTDSPTTGGSPPEANQTKPPSLTPVAPPAPKRAPGTLQVVDLPPIDEVTRRWAATDPIRPRVNPAASRCDQAQFLGPSITNASTRTFVIPGAKVNPAFGISQTIGLFQNPRKAVEFVDQIRKRMSGCQDRDLATTLDLVSEQRSKKTDLLIWQVTTEISDESTIRFSMAVVRTGRRVAQIGFMPSDENGMREQDFQALTERALQRLPRLGTEADRNPAKDPNPTDQPTDQPSGSPSAPTDNQPSPPPSDVPSGTD